MSATDSRSLTVVQVLGGEWGQDASVVEEVRNVLKRYPNAEFEEYSVGALAFLDARVGTHPSGCGIYDTVGMRRVGKKNG